MPISLIITNTIAYISAEIFEAKLFKVSRLIQVDKCSVKEGKREEEEGSSEVPTYRTTSRYYQICYLALTATCVRWIGVSSI